MKGGPRTSSGTCSLKLNDAEWEHSAPASTRSVTSSKNIASQADGTDTGVPTLDRLTAEQNLARLAEVASAVRDPAVPVFKHGDRTS